MQSNDSLFSFSLFKKTFLFTTLLLSFILSGNRTYATHAMGMDLSYVQLSQDSFLITLAFYRDCAGVAAPSSADLRIRSTSCNRDFTITLPRIGNGNETTPICTSLVTKCNGGSFPGSEEYIYRRIVVLPAQCNDWVISNFICCRNNGITTINSPGQKNIYVEAKINNFFTNSSPNFSNPPVPFVCANQLYCFNNGAIDPDGDSLVYSLVTPRTGINLSDTVTFKNGFNKFNPITSTPGVTLDSVTGDLCMFPTDSTEVAVLAVLVEEYRNGVKISSIMRDIQLRILGCPNGNDLPIASGIDSSLTYTTKICANSTLNFNVYAADNDTSQDVTMTWNQAINNATFTISGGSRPVGAFSWTPTINEVRSQPYCFTVTVTDDNCPFNGQQVFSYCIYVVGVAAIADSLFDPTCFNSCDGRATVRVVNGIPPFSYVWNDPATQPTARATGLCAGSYLATGTDSTGCTTSTTILLTDPKQIQLIMDSVPVSCAGGSDGMAIVQNVLFTAPPYTYKWEVNAGLQVSDTAFNLMAGIYAVTVTDSNGCEGIDSVTVLEPLPLSLSMINIANVSCNGLDDGQAMVQVSGGTAPYTYQWAAFTNSQTTDTAFNLLAGTHVVVITDANGCTQTDSIVITEPNTAINLTLTKVDINCTGDTTGQATVIPSGGTPPYNYTWSANTGNQTTQTAINLMAGVYSVVVTDSNNCVAYPNIDITEPLNALSITPIDSFVACNGDINGVAGVQVNGGTSPYNFIWDPAAGSQTTQYASNLSAGIYQAKVTDSLGCFDSVNVQVLEAISPLLVGINKVNVSCNNGSDGNAFVNISGGQPSYAILWDTNANSQTTDTAFNLSAGTYSVSVVDSFGCTIDTSIIVTEPPPLLTLTISSSNVTCYGDSNGMASVVVAGGTPPYQYLWTANAGSQTNDTAFGLLAGIYFVTVFDSNYCVTSPAIVINEPTSALLASTQGFDANCFNASDGFAVVSGLGGTAPYTYQWGTLAGSQTGDTAFNLSAQIYDVSIIDSFNCVYDTVVQVSQPSAPLQINLSAAPVNCFSGGDGEAYAIITGGTAPYSLLWGINSGAQTNDTAIGLTSGYHLLTVNDINNCDLTDSIFVGGPAEPLILSTTVIPVTCNGLSNGIAVAEGSGGTFPYTYQWDSNTGHQANDTAFNLAAGFYSVVITDTNNCDTNITVLITQPDLLEDSVYITSNFNGTAVRCFGDSNAAATAVAFGGSAPYQFLWDNGAGNQTTDTAFNLSEGVYSVLITDTNGCTTQGSISVDSPQKMGFTINEFINISCFGGSDGRISVSGLGGNAPYQYTWNTSPVVNDSILDSVPQGNYMITMTDANGCTFDTTYVLTQPSVLLIDSLTASDAKCFGQASGSARVVGAGGTLPYSYLWQLSSSAFQITQTAVNLSPATYPVRLSDAKGCFVNDTVVIGSPDEILLTTSDNDTTCAFQTTTISASASQGVGPYKFVWQPSGGDSLASQIVAPAKTSTYTVRALDNNGCFSAPGFITVLVRNMDNDTMAVFSDGNICEGDTGVVFGFHNGPFDNYFYNWNFGETELGPYRVYPTTATYFTMTVSDVCGNSLKDSVLIQVYPNPELYLDSLLEIGCNPLTIGFNDTVNSMPNLRYVWQFGDGNGSNQKNPTYTYLDSGTFNVVLSITSGNNCTTTNASEPSLVQVHASPTAQFIASPRVTDMRNPIINFTNQSVGANAYSWKFGDGDTSNVISPQHIYGDTGTYKVILISTSDMACQDTSILDVLIQAYYTIDVPNAFTPGQNEGGNWKNDPESNAIFYPYTTHPEAVKVFEMIIFNRWGELIFESTNIYTGWDGFYRGKISPQEVYVYKIELTWENGQTFEKMGDLTLFR